MFEDRTPERIKAEILEDMARYGGGLSVREGGFADTLAGGIAVEQYRVLQSLNAMVPIVYVDETSGEYIDRACARYGIERKAGTRAAAVMTLTGKAGTKVPKGTAFLSAAGLGFVTVQDVVLSGGADAAEAQAEEPGAAYNVEAGEINQMVLTISGLESWTNAAAAGGTDPEGDAALCARLYDYLQKPAASGNVYHYERWAMEVDGVGAARVFPLWNGPGTVKVLIIDGNREPAAQSIVDAAAAHIEGQRPIGAAVTVKSAEKLSVDVAYTAVLDGSATQEAVRTAFTQSLEAYIKGLTFRDYTLLYNRVALLLLSVPGVRDYTALTVNGGTVNVPIGQDQVPVPGEVRAS